MSTFNMRPRGATAKAWQWSAGHEGLEEFIRREDLDAELKVGHDALMKDGYTFSILPRGLVEIPNDAAYLSTNDEMQAFRAGWVLPGHVVVWHYGDWDVYESWDNVLARYEIVDEE